MPKLTQATVFKAQVPKAETSMDKTTRIVKKMIEDEAELRNGKNARLRKARLEREAGTPAAAVVARKKPSAKAKKKT